MNIKFLNKHLLAFMAVMLLGNVYSQSQVSGSVSDSDNMTGIPGVNVIIEGQVLVQLQISTEILS